MWNMHSIETESILMESPRLLLLSFSLQEEKNFSQIVYFEIEFNGIKNWKDETKWTAKYRIDRNKSRTKHKYFSFLWLSTKFAHTELIDFSDLKKKEKKRRNSEKKHIPIPFFSYCANSMDILVPRGQPNDTFSESHVVFWNVRNVPDRRAV